MKSYSKEGEAAFVEAGRLWALHDGLITSMSAENVNGRVLVRIDCTSRPDSPAREVRLKFSDSKDVEAEFVLRE